MLGEYSRGLLRETLTGNLTSGQRGNYRPIELINSIAIIYHVHCDLHYFPLILSVTVFLYEIK